MEEKKKDQKKEKSRSCRAAAEGDTMNEQKMKVKAKILDEAAMSRALVRIAHEITEHNRGASDLVLVGIIRRGVPIAQKIADNIEKIEGVRPPVGSLDITFYRDDLSRINVQPVLHGSDLPTVDGKNVILIDDVIYTGRTVRAAMEGVFRQGRPATVQLAVLIDRGLRELPFKPDYVGKNIPTSRSEVVSVKVEKIDGEDSVSILSPEE